MFSSPAGAAAAAAGEDEGGAPVAADTVVDTVDNVASTPPAEAAAVTPGDAAAEAEARTTSPTTAEVDAANSPAGSSGPLPPQSIPTDPSTEAMLSEARVPETEGVTAADEAVPGVEVAVAVEGEDEAGKSKLGSSLRDVGLDAAAVVPEGGTASQPEM